MTDYEKIQNMSVMFTFGKNGKIDGKAWVDINIPPVLLEQVLPAGLSPVYRLDDYDESELNLIDACLAKSTVNYSPLAENHIF